MKRLTGWMMLRTKPPEPTLPWQGLTLILMDDRGIEAVNRAVFARAEATDVITCHYVNVPGEPPGRTAEIIVNIERAARHSGPHWSVAQELALYVAHGCDHLAGHDDGDDAARRRMRRRELRWVRQAAAAGLLAELIGA